MNSVEAMKALLAGERVAGAMWRSAGWLEIRDGELVETNDGGASFHGGYLPHNAHRFKIVPREPTLLELARKIWPGATGINSCRRVAGDDAWSTFVEHGGPHVTCMFLYARDMEHGEKRLRLALEAIIKAEGL